MSGKTKSNANTPPQFSLLENAMLGSQGDNLAFGSLIESDDDIPIAGSALDESQEFNLGSESSKPWSLMIGDDSEIPLDSETQSASLATNVNSVSEILSAQNFSRSTENLISTNPFSHKTLPTYTDPIAENMKKNLSQEKSSSQEKSAKSNTSLPSSQNSGWKSTRRNKAQVVEDSASPAKEETVEKEKKASTRGRKKKSLGESEEDKENNNSNSVENEAEASPKSSGRKSTRAKTAPKTKGKKEESKDEDEEMKEDSPKEDTKKKAAKGRKKKGQPLSQEEQIEEGLEQMSIEESPKMSKTEAAKAKREEAKKKKEEEAAAAKRKKEEEEEEKKRKEKEEEEEEEAAKKKEEEEQKEKEKAKKKESVSKDEKPKRGRKPTKKESIDTSNAEGDLESILGSTKETEEKEKKETPKKRKRGDAKELEGDDEMKDDIESEKSKSKSKSNSKKEIKKESKKKDTKKKSSKKEKSKKDSDENNNEDEEEKEMHHSEEEEEEEDIPLEDDEDNQEEEEEEEEEEEDIKDGPKKKARLSGYDSDEDPDPSDQRPGICFTGLNPQQVKSFEKLLAQPAFDKFRICDKVYPCVTHIIVGEIKRTVKVVMGIAKGAWILKHEWLESSYEKKSFQKEADFELNDVWSGCIESRKAKDREATLFRGKKIHINGLRTTVPINQLKKIVAYSGGVIVKSLKECDICISTPLASTPARTNKRILGEKYILDCVSKFEELDDAEYCLFKKC